MFRGTVSQELWMKTKYLLEIYFGHLSDDYMLSYEAPTSGAWAVTKAQPSSSSLNVQGQSAHPQYWGGGLDAQSPSPSPRDPLPKLRAASAPHRWQTRHKIAPAGGVSTLCPRAKDVKKVLSRLTEKAPRNSYNSWIKKKKNHEKSKQPNWKV